MSTHQFSGHHHQEKFQKLPTPTGRPPYRIRLEDILPEDRIKTIKEAGKLVFHTVGDTGGIQSGAAQYIVSQHMEKDLGESHDRDKPAFFYHLGDVVYYYGEAEHYYAQFYDPYKGYDAPIFAIPGNHDGDVLDNGVSSLAAFTDNFCAPVPEITPEAGDVSRTAMTQPNVYWTLLTPFATIIGLYTNVPEHGELDRDQIDWLHNEMRVADKEQALIIAMHHPIYSGDKWHSGSAYMGDILDTAIRDSQRIPDLVLAGHVHNYQHFTRQYKQNGRSYRIPYIVAGAGGYFHLHYEKLANGRLTEPVTHIDGDQVELNKSCDDRHGFLRLEVDKNAIRGKYIAVPRPHESWRNGVQGKTGEIDSFEQPLRVPAGVR